MTSDQGPTCPSVTRGKLLNPAHLEPLSEAQRPAPIACSLLMVLIQAHSASAFALKHDMPLPTDSVVLLWPRRHAVLSFRIRF